MTQGVQNLDFSTVLASSIHDMKNSLSMLLNTLDDVMYQCEPADCRFYNGFTQLQYEGKRLNDHLIQLLAFYRINNAQYYANITEQCLGDFLDEALLQHHEMLKFRNIEFDIDCPVDLYCFIDKDLMAGVITNVINNLYKYTKDKMMISAYTENGYLAICIKDNGPGYPEDMLYSEVKQQKGIDFKSGSTGLGLYFAILAAQMHKNKGRKGYITTTNNGINGGGCFTIFIP
ncbi:MAG: HAMP domain-containing sensor histidine kinase [Gammaproteobacteria bacterium]